MQIKVIDFGFAKFFGQHTTSSQVREQCSEGRLGGDAAASSPQIHVLAVRILGT